MFGNYSKVLHSTKLWLNEKTFDAVRALVTADEDGDLEFEFGLSDGSDSILFASYAYDLESVEETEEYLKRLAVIRNVLNAHISVASEKLAEKRELEEKKLVEKQKENG